MDARVPRSPRTGQTTQGQRTAVRSCLKTSRGLSELGLGRLTGRTHEVLLLQRGDEPSSSIGEPGTVPLSQLGVNTLLVFLHENREGIPCQQWHPPAGLGSMVYSRSTAILILPTRETSTYCIWLQGRCVVHESDSTHAFSCNRTGTEGVCVGVRRAHPYLMGLSRGHCCCKRFVRKRTYAR